MNLGHFFLYSLRKEWDSNPQKNKDTYRGFVLCPYYFLHRSGLTSSIPALLRASLQKKD